MKKIVLIVSLILSWNFALAQKKWKASEKDSMNMARLLIDENNFDLALPILEVLYNNHFDDYSLKFLYGNCALHRADKRGLSLSLLNQVYNKNKKASNIEYSLAQAFHYNYKFDSAQIMIDQYLKSDEITSESRVSAEQTKKYISNAKYFYEHPTNVKITNLGSKINTQYDDYVPVLTADESIIVYTYRGLGSKGGKQNAYQESDKKGKYYEDVYYAEKIDGNWGDPSGIDVVNSNLHDAAIGLSLDGNMLFTYHNYGKDQGDISVSYLNGKSWSAPVKLKGEVNTNKWEGSCSLSPDGKTLYFSSERDGGFGGRDIYKATLINDSIWGKVTNLGDSINTSFDDDAPFIHADGLTLFFSSRGRNSMGDYDVFQAKMDPVDSMFRSPKNLGHPLNTPFNDRYLVVSANAEMGFYSSEKTDGFGLNDIYSVTPGYIGEAPSVYLVKGKVTDNGAVIKSQIDVQIVTKNYKQFTSVVPNSVTGKYIIALPSGEIFDLVFMFKDKPWRTIKIDASNISNFHSEDLNIDFTIMERLDSLKTAQKYNDSINKIIKDRSVEVTNKLSKFCSKGLKYRVQIAAYKNQKNVSFDHLTQFGTIEKQKDNKGLTIMTIGGLFESLEEAISLCKAVKKAGQVDSFVNAECNGKRIYLKELKELSSFDSFK